ncbi:uncharacterized protein METZ01_LOCUS24361 [marine metagenome]|uniref:Uncharacterized protein n=1 Tax=marine metagenome TaxID=408172 RepID=A0A381PZU7_9ZZZZ
MAGKGDRQGASGKNNQRRSGGDTPADSIHTSPRLGRHGHPSGHHKENQADTQGCIIPAGKEQRYGDQ